MRHFYKQSGGDVPKFEPVKRLNNRVVDKLIRDLRRIYKENPALFDLPTFALKVYSSRLESSQPAR